ncbi:hypothetical protein ACLQ2P_01060 [Actinomadura citrea]|uniref:hypothetical protein n=1 Tax=Actinomadura citrea TaxID=46158 RepID=UPI003CE5BF65
MVFLQMSQCMGASSEARSHSTVVAPVELEGEQRDGERVLDQALGPTFGDVVDVKAGSAFVEAPPHAALVVLRQCFSEETTGGGEIVAARTPMVPS